MSELSTVPIRFRLADILRERGEPQAVFARRAGLSNTAVNEIALEKTQRVSLATIEALCRALGCTPSDLFEITGPPLPASRKRAK
jgi:DNA-binding Xre family transcriptional regulator